MVICQYYYTILLLDEKDAAESQLPRTEASDILERGSMNMNGRHKDHINVEINDKYAAKINTIATALRKIYNASLTRVTNTFSDIKCDFNDL
jgi:hypothetical protein